MVYRKGTYIKRRTMRCIGRVLILREEQCGVWEGYLYQEKNNAVYGKGTYIKSGTMRCMGRVLILREEQ